MLEARSALGVPCGNAKATRAGPTFTRFRNRLTLKTTWQRPLSGDVQSAIAWDKYTGCGGLSIGKAAQKHGEEEDRKESSTAATATATETTSRIRPWLVAGREFPGRRPSRARGNP